MACICSATERYEALHRELARGWNTWDTRSVLTHVFLPNALAIDLQLEDSLGKRATRFLIGDRSADAPLLHPYAHSYDGGYTCLCVSWHGIDMKVESAARDSALVILISPISSASGWLIVSPKGLWGRGCQAECSETSFEIGPRRSEFMLHGSFAGGKPTLDGNTYFLSLDSPLAICCGVNLNLQKAQEWIKASADSLDNYKRKRYPDNYDCYNAMSTIMGWNCIYDPQIRRVITPVSRIWSSQWFASQDFGGFCLFCWDTYFAALMLGIDNKELAYANALEITLAADGVGFVPNCYYSNGFKSRDRSQPPVGSMAFWKLYERYGDKWVLSEAYPRLKVWNDWWLQNRLCDGLLCLGSSPYQRVTYFRSEYDQNTKYASCLESGLDNSPMFDGVPFDTNTHLMQQQDVGISSLFAMDCEYLSKIATELGYADDAAELAVRAEYMRQQLSRLWDEGRGFYYNRSTVDGSFNCRISPTCFYPLLAQAPSQAQAQRMIDNYLLNPEYFWGKYVIPSSPRCDPSSKDNDYWRGRIWAPLNYLVYLGLCNYDLPEVRAQFVEKSKALLLKSWLSRGYIFENYNAETGEGDDTLRSDKFYHWGALLSLIALENEK